MSTQQNSSSQVSFTSLTPDQLVANGYLPTSEAANAWGVSSTTLKRRAQDQGFLSRVSVVRDSRNAYWFQVYRNATQQAQAEGISRRTLGRRAGSYSTILRDGRRLFLVSIR
jgi:hypothetical protein